MDVLAEGHHPAARSNLAHGSENYLEDLKLQRLVENLFEDLGRNPSLALGVMDLPSMHWQKEAG